MNNQKVNQWLKERNLICEESFGEALYRLGMTYKRDNGITLTEVWERLGTNRKRVSDWVNHPTNSMMRTATIINVIEAAAKLFGEEEANTLSYKAGFTRKLNEKSNVEFKKFLDDKLSLITSTKAELYEQAGIDERAFYRIKTGKHLRKELLLPILITMNLTLEEIAEGLNLAGYCLSSSIPTDLLVTHFIKNRQKYMPHIVLINEINDTLESLDMPLLMSRIENNS